MPAIASSKPAAKDFPEQLCSLRGGIFADSLFFLAEFVKEAVQGFADDIGIKVEALTGAEARDRWILRNGVVLSDHTHLQHGLMDDGSKCCGQFLSALALEVVGGGRVTASQDAAGVAKGHARKRADENLFSLRRGLLRGPVHPDLQFIHPCAHTQKAHGPAGALKFRWQQDPDGLVPQKSVGPPSRSYGLARADAERFFESRGDLIVAKAVDACSWLTQRGFSFLFQHV